ncbi:hypothetical protein FIBSPDRAFT_992819 [Athelia psychrophila]|uniref:Uncharacterized protein n=1 Tax=Athelia psychrophila TaxID=1759441 RepID=A0A165YHQ6_9AGAM|nr:hypothetical protein FIBSPDRAFT_992819 [Fibularhizoctonia sp. CBS 109695]
MPLPTPPSAPPKPGLRPGLGLLNILSPAPAQAHYWAGLRPGFFGRAGPGFGPVAQPSTSLIGPLWTILNIDNSFRVFAIQSFLVFLRRLYTIMQDSSWAHKEPASLDPDLQSPTIAD